MEEVDVLKRRLAHEQAARKQAERVLHAKTKALNRSNYQLSQLTASQETEITRRLEEQRAKEVYHRQLVESVEDLIAVVSREGCFKYVSPAAERLLGYTQAECIGMSATRLVHPDYLPALVAAFWDRIEKRLPTGYDEYPIITKDGRVVWIGVVIRCIIENDEVVEMVGVARDITDREQIRRSEEKYRGIMNNMELGLLEVNNDQVVVRAYERFCQMLGYSADELIGKNAGELLAASSHREILEQQQRIREQGLSSSYELQLVRKDGSFIWMLISGVPIHNEHGELVGSMGIHYDLTERKNLEIELAGAKQAADEARQAEKQFLANMSHEIRTPLNAIIGMSHLLFDTQPTSQQREYIDILKTSADFLHSLISNLLDMTKIEAGRVELNPEPFDLAGLLRSTQKVFEMRLQDRPIQFNIMLDARISGDFVGDEMVINQILTNLVGNAEKFTDVGSIQLTVRIRHEDATAMWVEFAVADTGVGIPAEKLGLVFQKFKQVNPQGHKHKGTGLGLAITKELVELQGGTISVDSRIGHGSTFTFVLPFPKVAPPVVQQPVESPVVANQPKVGHILVVEDNLMNQKYIGSLLSKWQVRYTVASDGRQAVMEARRQRFDLILMDIQMPVMNGYEATVAIRNTHNPNQNAPIVALTASAMVDNKNVALEAGMTDFLTKPFDPGQLMVLLRQYPSTELGENYALQLDRNRLTDLYGDDRAAAADMFGTFLTSIVPELLQLPALCRQQNWPELARQAHKLKPTLGMVGLTRLEATMNRLEKAAGQAADPDLLNVYCQEVATALQEAIPLLEDEMQLFNEN